MAIFTICTTALDVQAERETFSFRCPDEGGAIRFSEGGWDGAQACAGLHRLGYALSADARTLPVVVRRELARRRRQNARDAA